ncbi:MAG: excinuclease ABC subunit UvrA [Vampirovibrionales bacterium]|nr:excinuclease ABC subunit UvrA [Vampirovibrionales bacterium]
MDTITVIKANEHNLNQVSLSIPRDKLVVFTGVSGSGKSSLAFDTIFAEGQRRYVESLSTYARQFIGQSEKPDVESIDGLSPAIAIDQKSTSRNPRSTVGTVTEISDYLRLLYAKIGTAHSPKTGEEITAHTPQSIIAQVNALPEGSKLQLFSPVVRGRKGDYNALFKQLRKEGYSRIRIDGELHLLEELAETHRLERNILHNIDVVVDRIVLKVDAKTQERLQSAVLGALKKSDGFVSVQILEDGSGKKKPRELFFSQHLALSDSELDEGGVAEMSPRLFSFNSPYGACPACEGLGVRYEISPELLIPEPDKSMAQGAIAPFEKFMGKYYATFIKRLAKRYSFDVETPYKKLSKKHQQFLMFGPDYDPRNSESSNQYMESVRQNPALEVEDDEDWFSLVSDFDGIMNILKRRYLNGTDATKHYIETFMREVLCPACKGARLKPLSLAVTLPDVRLSPQKQSSGGINIHQLGDRSIRDLYRYFQKLPGELNDYQMTIARQPLVEVSDRLLFLIEVGLEYLTLNRSAGSLSGGEAQRIRLASQIGSGLSGVLYVLDEPSIGLHQHNNIQLIKTLCKLRDQGNSLIVVEHDEETIRTADWVVDIGPKAGIHGGRIVAQGKMEAIKDNPQSLTGQYLSGKQAIAVPKKLRAGNGEKLTIKNATLHNLKNVSVDIPLGKFVCVTGLSGSGKSTLVYDVLYEVIHYEFGRYGARPEGYDEITGLEHIDKMICITQDPIGRSPRSNPATYTGIFDTIRNVFANTEDAKVRGYTASRFSFNVKGGRCEYCSGDGVIVKEMHFLPNVSLPCEHCGGKRYNRETLDVQYRGKTIADVLHMSVEEAYAHFEGIPKIQRSLKVMLDVGLDYIQLGQSSTTLSGGEAQRIKLATEFCKRSTGKTLYVLDEPSVGLHWDDLSKLIQLLNGLVDQGNTVLVIEHNLDLIKVADHIIDMGPEGGERGGEVIAQGTPRQVADTADSYTGQYLKPLLS